MKNSYYNFLVDYTENKKILFNSFTGNIIVLSAKNAENYIDMQYENKDFIKFLYSKGFLVDDTFDDKEHITSIHEGEKAQTDRLTLIIAPTLNCNFDCKYCFEDCYDEIMDKNVEDQLIHLLHTMKQKFKMLQVIWYGGEPLLNINSIIRLSQSFHDYCNLNDIVYYAVMITNGYLLDSKMVALLESCAIRAYQITIDGDRLVHDKRRMLKNGNGTFDKIINNIQLNQDLNIRLRVNIDSDNMQSFNEFLNTIEDMDLTNVTFDIAKVEYSNNDDFSFTNREYGQFLLRELSLSNNKTFKYFHLPTFKNAHCGFDLLGNMIIDPKGYLYKCWSCIGCRDKSYDNILDMDTLLSKNINGNGMAMDAHCRQCKFLPICMGGCANERQYTDYNCTHFKYILNDYLAEYIKKYSEFNA